MVLFSMYQSKCKKIFSAEMSSSVDTVIKMGSEGSKTMVGMDTKLYSQQTKKYYAFKNLEGLQQVCVKQWRHHYPTAL